MAVGEDLAANLWIEVWRRFLKLPVLAGTRFADSSGPNRGQSGPWEKFVASF
jgi:hypothetical protein